MRLLAVASTALAVVIAFNGSALAAEAEFPVYTGDQFVALRDHAMSHELPNLTIPDDRVPITGNEELDNRIYEMAFERGYVMTPIAVSELGTADGVRMQPQAAEAWLQLKAAAREEGLRFIVSSAYRSPASQRTQFLSKLEGSSDSAIEATLRWYSVPGTSKHHSGYALDFRYREGTFGEFRSTPDYEWLAADNFLIPKTFGFIPAYPDDVSEQGPNPEPWEFIWVGVELIKCGNPLEAPSTFIGPAAAIAQDVASCPGTNSGAGEAPLSLPVWLTRYAV